MQHEVGQEIELQAAWLAAAKATVQLSPRLCRARPLVERSRGHPEPGAISLAICLRTIGDLIAKPA